MLEICGYARCLFGFASVNCNQPNNSAECPQTHHKDLLVLYEPESGQTLICHRERLAERLAEKVIVVEVAKAVPCLVRAQDP